MYTVYILVSEKYPDRYYIGSTQDLKRRLVGHNSNKTQYSSKYGPWKLHAYIVLQSKQKAEGFERYLKSGSGFAFLKKRLL